VSGTKHVVGFSGGIDSQACALLVRQRYPAEDVILLNNDAGGNENPVNEEFIEKYSRTVHPVTRVTSLVRDFREWERDRDGRLTQRPRDTFAPDDPLTFDRLAHIMGRFPSSRAQFCTIFLKVAPQRRWLRENLTDQGIDFVRYVGVRRDESKKRKDTPDSWWDDANDCEVRAPIADWTKEQCFAFVQAAGEEFNPMYRMGFSRVGCSPCVNSTKEDIREWSARFPEMVEKVRQWEAETGKNFFPPCVPSGHYAMVDEVIAWSRTTRGGKQFALPLVEADAASGTCVSKYGLCE
jgi:3'-phosphoadenosine 5'-phosphosulfate sulfotransferase (PAPS reductase)/FAD synthetase